MSVETPAPDPLAIAHRRTRWVVAVCAASIVAAAAWSFWPIHIEPIAIDAPRGDAALGPPAAEPANTAEPLNLAAFEAPLWQMVEAPPPPAPKPVVQAPPPPPPPLKLQLLGISTEGQERRAVLYDPDQDRVFIVASGESVGGREVESITDDSVQLRDRAGVRTLALKAGRGP